MPFELRSTWICAKYARDFFSALPTELLLRLKPDRVEHPDADDTRRCSCPGVTRSQSAGFAISARLGYRRSANDSRRAQASRTNCCGAILICLVSDIRISIRGSTIPSDACSPVPIGIPNSCWIHIASSGIEEQNCPAGWRTKPRSSSAT